MKIALRQSPVIFDSETHTYLLDGVILQGITSTLVKRAFPDTYKKPAGYTDEEWEEVLNNAAAKGSNMHETIELYDELGVTSDLPELQSYIRIKEENKLKVLATEYVVSDEKNYATAIDKVLLTPDDEIIIVDFKRTSTKHYDNVALQLSICKRFFEMQNPDLKVAGCYLMWLRDKKSEFKKMPVWSDEQLDELIKADLANESFEVEKTYGNLPQRVAEVEDYLFQLESDVKEKTEELKRIKDGLCQMMLERGIKSFETDRIKMTTVTPKPREGFDSKSFQTDHPDLYQQYVKVGGESKPSVRITYKL